MTLKELWGLNDIYSKYQICRKMEKTATTKNIKSLMTQVWLRKEGDKCVPYEPGIDNTGKD